MWFKSKEQKAKEELERFQAWAKLQKEAENKAEQDRIKHEEELRQAAIQLEKEKFQALKNSDEPWCDWVAQGKNDVGQIQVKLDWNSAFIKYLRESGFDGHDEESIVQKYLAALAKSQWEDGKDNALNVFYNPPESPSAQELPEEK